MGALTGTAGGATLCHMQTGTLLDAYDSQLRGAAEMADAPDVLRLGPLLAGVFPARRRAFVSSAPFSMGGAELDDLIAEVIATCEADPRVDHISWKTRSHDPLPRLLSRLQHHGFALGEPETVIVGEADAVAAALAGQEPLRGYAVERAATEAQLREAEHLAGRVFEDSPERIRLQQDQLVERWQSAPRRSRCGRYATGTARWSVPGASSSPTVLTSRGSGAARAWTSTVGAGCTGPWWTREPARPGTGGGHCSTSTAASTRGPSSSGWGLCPSPR